MKLVLSSKNENLVNFNGQTIILKNGYTLIDIDQTTCFYVYPIGQTQNEIPFAFVVANENDKLTCNSNHVKTISFPTHLEVEILPFLVYGSDHAPLVNDFFTETEKNLKIHVKIYGCHQNNLQIKTNNSYFSDSIYGFEESSINCFESFIIISYKATSGYYIYIFDPQSSKKLLHCEIVQFELDKETKKLTILKKLKDSLSHGEIIEISLHNGFEILHRNLTYLEETTPIICKEIAFFDCVKAGNFKKAEEMITLELKTVLTKESAQQYFAEFSEIVQSKIDFKFYLLKNGNNQTATEIEFEFKDGLINNLKTLYNSEKKDDN